MKNRNLSRHDLYSSFVGDKEKERNEKRNVYENKRYYVRKTNQITRMTQTEFSRDY